MSLTLITPATEYPVTLDEVRDFVRETGEGKDAQLTAALAAAVSRYDGAEGLLNRALCSQTWELRLDEFPVGLGRIDLPLPPLQSVASIKYLDSDGAEQTLAASVYAAFNIDSPTRRGFIALKPDQSWPAISSQREAVRITFVAGYGTRNNVPEHTRALILFATKELYDHREPVGSRLEESPAYMGLFHQARFLSF